MISLIGMGCGPESLSREAAAAIENAELLLGAERLLAPYRETKHCISALTAGELAEALETETGEACVLFSGDSGFYSGARLLLPLLGDRPCRLLPGLSSVQVFAARLRRPWQDWLLCSAHGVDCDPVEAVTQGRPACFLTGGKRGPAALCRELTDAGLGGLSAAVGENLGLPDERVTRALTAELAERDYAPLSVLLAEAAPTMLPRAPGLPDSAFSRCEGVPMTKQEVRAALLAKLAPRPTDTCWDLGAGTGSVGVELAFRARRVYGVEREKAALQTAKENREKLGAWRLRLVEGEAPEALAGLPKPDAVFIGGSGGRLPEILRAVHRANPEARICVSAISLEGLQKAHSGLRELGKNVDLCQISVSRGKSAGELTLLLAQNPVFLLTGETP